MSPGETRLARATTSLYSGSDSKSAGISAKTYFDNETRLMIELPVDKVFCDKVADVYRQAGCWTWSDEWTWFDTEFYMEAPRKQVFSKTQAHLFPLNFFNIDPN